MLKTKRQELIVDLIQRQNIETQEELAEALRNMGFQVTQATVSRDIKELHLIKAASADNGYKYALPEKKENGLNDKLIRILTDSLVSVDYAGHMIVVKTLSGSANIAAEALDTLKWPEILGTIAGDNTIFIVVRSGQDAAAIADRIRKTANS